VQGESLNNPITINGQLFNNPVVIGTDGTLNLPNGLSAAQLTIRRND